MIEEIEKRLENGEVVELECVDRIGFLKDIESEANEKILDQGPLVVDYIDYDGDIRLIGGIGGIYLNVIISEEFKYFRIKEKPKNAADITSHAHKGVTSGVETTQTKDSPYIEDNPTFDDLIDVAVKAHKDGLLRSIAIENCSILITKNDYGKRYYKKGFDSYSEAIKWVNSLYTETFVIESESDTNKLISGGKTVLKNGEVLEFSNNYNGCLWFNFNDYESGVFPFIALKGATVTQKRG